MGRNDRGPRCPESLNYQCPTCGAPPMEWCWATTKREAERYPNHREVPGEPGMVFVDVPAGFIHVARYRLRGPKMITRKSPTMWDLCRAQELRIKKEMH